MTRRALWRGEKLTGLADPGGIPMLPPSPRPADEDEEASIRGRGGLVAAARQSRPVRSGGVGDGPIRARIRR